MGFELRTGSRRLAEQHQQQKLEDAYAEYQNERWLERMQVRLPEWVLEETGATLTFEEFVSVHRDGVPEEWVRAARRGLSDPRTEGDL